MTLTAELALDSNGSTLQFCPAPELNHCLAVGTYQLDEARQERSGAVSLWSLPTNTHSTSPPAPLCTFPTAGVFDLKWLNVLDRPILAAGLSQGRVQCFQTVEAPDVNQPTLNLVSEAQCFAGAMCSCIDSAAGDQSGSLAVSSSDGMLGMLLQVSSSE